MVQWELGGNAQRLPGVTFLMMPGPAHHQGNLTLDAYGSRWSSSHDGQPCSQFKAFALAHKGKATSDVSYNSEDPPSTYSNANVHSRIF